MTKRGVLLALMLSGMLAGCATLPFSSVGVTFVAVAPPQARRDVREPRPGPGSVWIEGNWAWSGGAYLWMPGRWERQPEGRRGWEQGRWRHHGRNGWFWSPGHWR